MEEERLDTRFQLNVKSITNFHGLLTLQGTITAAAGGTAGEYKCPSFQHAVITKLISTIIYADNNVLLVDPISSNR